MQLIPEFLSFFDASILIVSSFFTSFLSAAIGLGGGVTLLAVMAQILPAPHIVPVHGVAQLGSNISRSTLMRKHIDFRVIGYFLIGSLIGAAIGGQLVVSIEAGILQIILAAFILYATWGPKPSAKASSKYAVGIGGTLSTLLTMFVGATGPFVAALFKPQGFKRETQVATMSAGMVVQHSLKLVIFGLLGFAFGPYIPLLAMIICSGLLGTLAGRHLLLKTSEELFSKLLNLVLTLLALRLLYVGFTGL